MALADPAEGLHGLTVGVLQARHGRELAALVEKHGGVPVHAPCMREVEPEDRDAVGEAIRRAAGGPLDMAVFLTGCGAAALFAAASDTGAYEPLITRLHSAIVVARGPKPLAVLHRHRLAVDRRTREPHTTEQVVELVGGALHDRTVLLQHYGIENIRLRDHLLDAGAHVVEVRPYAWAAPPDLERVHRLLGRLEAGELDITVFTSASQVHTLFQIAEGERRDGELSRWLRERTVVAAVGPVCAAALGDYGVAAQIQPDRPKMVPLVRALCEHASSAFATATTKDEVH
ncbi:MAG TPA: uroporphyrinogen-III synthase [Candidatus Dormibacteraeota bacterium]